MAENTGRKSSFANSKHERSWITNKMSSSSNEYLLDYSSKCHQTSLRDILFSKQTPKPLIDPKVSPSVNEPPTSIMEPIFIETLSNETVYSSSLSKYYGTSLFGRETRAIQQKRQIQRVVRNDDVRQNLSENKETNEKFRTVWKELQSGSSTSTSTTTGPPSLHSQTEISPTEEIECAPRNKASSLQLKPPISILERLLISTSNENSPYSHKTPTMDPMVFQNLNSSPNRESFNMYPDCSERAELSFTKEVPFSTQPCQSNPLFRQISEDFSNSITNADLEVPNLLQPKYKDNDRMSHDLHDSSEIQNCTSKWKSMICAKYERNTEEADNAKTTSLSPKCAVDAPLDLVIHGLDHPSFQKRVVASSFSTQELASSTQVLPEDKSRREMATQTEDKIACNNPFFYGFNDHVSESKLMKWKYRLMKRYETEEAKFNESYLFSPKM